MFEADDKKKEGRIEFADGQKTTKRYLEFRLSTRQKRKKTLLWKKEEKKTEFFAIEIKDVTKDLKLENISWKSDKKTKRILTER